MKTLAIIGRILFALPFGVMGVNHFLMKDYFLLMKTSFIPGGGFTILLTGFILIVACILIIMNKFIKTVCYCLAGLLLIFILTIHIPGLSTTDWQIVLYSTVLTNTIHTMFSSSGLCSNITMLLCRQVFSIVSTTNSWKRRSISHCLWKSLFITHWARTGKSASRATLYVHYTIKLWSNRHDYRHYSGSWRQQRATA